MFYCLVHINIIQNGRTANNDMFEQDEGYKEDRDGL